MRGRISFSKGFSPLLISSLIILFFAGCSENSSILDNGGNRQLEFSVSAHGWNSPDKSPDQKVSSRATPITGTKFDTSKNFNVIADVNKGGNWSTEVNNEIASYSAENKIWQTSATYYWPGTGSTVDFYAYYPTSILNKITHTAGSVPVLSYTVPDNATDKIDILASSKTGVAGNSYNQTPVDFKHILAAVLFRVGSSGMINGTITKISLNGIQNTGSYSFTSGWTPQTSNTTTYTKNVSAAGDAGTEIVSGNDPFLVMPQTLSNASFTVTYSGGATLTKSLSGTWEAGKVYEYNINSSFSATQDFNYTGNVQSYTVPFTGTYKIQCWGASGGDLNNYVGGKGAYTNGNIQLNKNQILYIYIGELGGKTAIASTPFNSGSCQTDNGVEWQWGRAGGGATDIRLTSGAWNKFESLKSRIMVAAGGGGADNRNCTEIGNTTGPYYGDGNGGYGGALTGGSGTTENHTNPSNNLTGGYFTNTGATQTTAGYDTSILYSSINSGYGGGFGYSNGNAQAGGGGGYYGGASVLHCGGSGGSSFISGYPGCNAISESSTSTNIIHTGSPNHYSGYVFTNMEMIAGDSQMPAPSGGTETGHSGNGYARITFVSAN